MKTNQLKKNPENGAPRGARKGRRGEKKEEFETVARSALSESFIKDYAETDFDAFLRNNETAAFGEGAEAVRRGTNGENGSDVFGNESDIQSIDKSPNMESSDTENRKSDDSDRSETETEKTGGEFENPKTELSDAERKKKIRDLKRAIRLFDAELKIIGFGGDPEKANLKEFAAEFID